MSKNQELISIITHDGQFHADETLACALVQYVFGNVPIVRKRKITKDEYNNKSIFIIDVGNTLNREYHNFDHHQDAGLPASNMLVLEYLKAKRFITNDLYEELYYRFEQVSNIDCNGYKAVGKGWHVNSLFKTLNGVCDEDGDNTEGFNLAVEIGKAVIIAAQNTIYESEKSRKYWSEGVKHSRFIQVCDKYPIKWRDYEGATLLVFNATSPENEHEHWKVQSIDGSVLPLVMTGKELFMHKNRFIAAYDSKQNAIECAELTEMAIDNAKVTL